jgi:DNA-binding PadR family transcriptional regulator
MVPDDNEPWRPERPRRFFRSGELHLVLLALVGERPRHGYELMSELTARFGPEYKPSPGSIYPALTALEEEDLVVSEDDGDRRVYRLSPVGARALEDRRAVLAKVEARTGTRFGPGSLEPALADLAARVRAVAHLVDEDEALQILDATAGRIEELSTKRRGT